MGLIKSKSEMRRIATLDPHAAAAELDRLRRELELAKAVVEASRKWVSGHIVGEAVNAEVKAAIEAYDAEVKSQ